MNSALPSYDEARQMVAARVAELVCHGPSERLALHLASGRVLAEPLRADRDQPAFDRSTRDGYGCRAAEASAHGWLKIAGSTRAGQMPAGPLPAQAAWEIMTGAAIPQGVDAVMMLEHVEVGEGQVRLVPPRVLTPGENLVLQGAQARANDRLLATGTLIGFAQIALAASCGFAELEVFPRPRVAILSTGDEIVPVQSSPGPGQIRNANGPMLAALVARAGGEPWLLPVVRDTEEALDRALAEAAGADLLLITGGVSAGKFDLVEPALARRGARFDFTGVRIQPGKPLVFGRLPAAAKRDIGQDPRGGILFFGLPGNPLSTAVTFLVFAEPVLTALTGRLDRSAPWVPARLVREVDGKSGLTRILPASCTFPDQNGQLPEVSAVAWQGSGDLAALARSNCFLLVPEPVDRLRAGEQVQILVL
jgi:molybdopterin molybdotransferase